MKIEFSQIFESTQISNFIKIRPVEAEFFNEGRQTDIRTDMKKLTIAFRIFANAPKERFHYTNFVFCIPFLFIKKTF